MKEVLLIRDLVIQNRTCRRFHQDVSIKRETIEELIDLARCSASGANRQPLKYIISCDPPKNALIFPCLGWAGYFIDWPGPPEGERPTAHIVMLGDTEISKNFFCDHGIAAQSILLGAREKGLAGCIHGAIKKVKLRRALGIPPHYEILLVISLGKPKEKVVLETVGPDGDIKYWRDSEGVHHVPKRLLKDIIIG
jgi:nitroreductase